MHKGMAMARSSTTGFCTPPHQHWRSQGLPCTTGRFCRTRDSETASGAELGVEAVGVRKV